MIIFSRNHLRIEDVYAVAYEDSDCELSSDKQFRAMIAQGCDFLERVLQEDGEIYGVTTGYGDSCTVRIPSNLVQELPKQLYTFHGCGLGAIFDPQMTRAIIATRLRSLCHGYSGVSVALLEQLEKLLHCNILPLIPEEGSVGASGDLTPLSYLAAVLCGERQVYYRGENRDTLDVFKECGIQPLVLRPKEGLAIMNGTAVMTAIACVAFTRAAYLSKLATRITAMAVLATKGNAHHFDERLFAVKPHPGQQKVATRLRMDLSDNAGVRNPKRLQDRYSLRCAPHVIGVLEDSLPWLRQLIENELNSANDNPIIDGENECILHGGHFYGGHIALAMDSLKTSVANIADLLDRQMALILDPKFNHGLPANVSGAQGERAAINHGMKALHIAASAWCAEALKLTMPASVFSRSTECHNQDKVSMGTIAARDCMRVLQLSEQVATAALLASCQGVELRIAAGELSAEDCAPALMESIALVREISPFLDQDRALEQELRSLIAAIQKQTWPLYEEPGHA